MNETGKGKALTHKTVTISYSKQEQAISNQ